MHVAVVLETNISFSFNTPGSSTIASRVLLIVQLQQKKTFIFSILCDVMYDRRITSASFRLWFCVFTVQSIEHVSILGLFILHVSTALI